MLTILSKNYPSQQRNANDKIYDFMPRNDDKLLEVYDEEGNVAFSMELTYDGIILLNGYFVSDNNLAVIGKGYSPCLPLDYPKYDSIAKTRIATIRKYRQ